MLAVAAVLALSAGVQPGAACVATARDVAAGEHVSTDLLEPVMCRADARPARGLRFDPLSGSVTAADALPAGTYLGRLLVPETAMLPKGSRVTLRATFGPAIVERQVTTLQPARSGQRVFVRDDGGHVFAVALVVTGGGAEIR